MKKYLTFLLILIFSTGLFAGLSAKKQKEAKSYFQSGLRFYLKRDFKKASEEWQKTLNIDVENKKAKEYLNKAQAKYYNSLELYYKGIELFQNKEFDKAEEQFKQSLLINPLNDKVKYYIKLCHTPQISISTIKKYFSANITNAFVINLNKEDTTKRWEENWNLHIFNGEKIVKTIKGSGYVPEKIIWMADNDKGKVILEEKTLKSILQIKSFFGRVVDSKEVPIAIDNVGPHLQIESEKSFFPDNEKKDNVIHFLIIGKDKMAGVKNIKIEIYDNEKKKILKTITSPLDKSQLKYTWTGDLDDGSKISGGSVVWYKVIAMDNANNQTESEYKKIDANITLKKEEKGLVMNLPNIEFAFGKANLRRKSYEILNKVGDILKQYERAKFIIEGHTDNVGSHDRNLALSKKRAEAVLRYLSSKYKIKKDRVEIKGYGDSRPIAPNDTEAGRAKNRRVEIVIVSE